MLTFAIKDYDGTIAIRYPRGGEKRSFDNGDFVPGKAKTVRPGRDLTIAAYGSMVSRAMDCAEALEEKGISAEVIDLRTIKPLDADTVIKSASATGKLAFMEEVVRRGGIGEQLLANIQQRNIDIKVKLITLPDTFIIHGTTDELEAAYGFTAKGLLKSVEEIL